MITTHIQPSLEDRQAARVALSKVLAARLFEDWLKEQSAAGHIPADAAAAEAQAAQQEV